MLAVRDKIQTGATALFLDLDGTVIDIAARPEEVRPRADLAERLRTVAERLGGALAILSGRPIADIDALTAPLRLPAAGVHGAERRRAPDGPILVDAPFAPPGLIDAVRRLAANREGVLVEPKAYSIAVHYRLAPDQGPPLEAGLRRLLAADAGDHVLTLGRRVFEITPRAASKGAALAAFMREPPFAGRRPVMVGDDVTDETAMAAARCLGGAGLKVAGEHFAFESSDFADPADVFDWLEAIAKGG